MTLRDRDTRNFPWRASLVLALVACAPEPGDPFVPILESDHLRIGTSFDVRPCMGFVNLWEAQLKAIEDALGVSSDVVWLYIYENDETEQIGEDCGFDPPMGANGCWADPVVRSTLWSILHELVHAWTAVANRKALPVLQEGVAERMSGTVPQHRWEGLTVGALLTTPPGNYENASHFVAWLLDAYGAETFMKLYTHTSRGMSEAALANAFESILGTTPDDLVLAYQTSARDYYPAMGGAACGRAPAISWRDGAATWPSEGSCEDGPFLGYETSEWWQGVTIEVASPGQYVLDVGGRGAALIRCLTAPADEWELPTLHGWVSGDWRHPDALYDPAVAEGGTYGLGDWADQVLELDAGTYEVWVERPRWEVPGFEDDMGLFKL